MSAPLSEITQFFAMAPAAVDPATGQPTQPVWASMVLPFLAVAMFYFLLIRPQIKARKEQDKLITALKSGDQVITSSGILGTVTNVKDKTLIVRIADNVKVELLKSAVVTVTKSESEVVAA